MSGRCPKGTRRNKKTGKCEPHGVPAVVRVAPVQPAIAQVVAPAPVALPDNWQIATPIKASPVKQKTASPLPPPPPKQKTASPHPHHEDICIPIEDFKPMLVTQLLEKYISVPVLLLIPVDRDIPIIEVINLPIEKKLDKIYKNFHSEDAFLQRRGTEIFEYTTEDSTFWFYHIPNTFFRAWVRKYEIPHSLDSKP